MRRPLAGVVLALAVAASGSAGCAAPYDDDGEAAAGGPLPGAATVADDARRVVVDTDLGGDDLVALAFLLRRPDVRVEAVTIAATGLVGCEPGVDLVADLVHAVGAGWVPVACGRPEPGPGGRAMPAAWRELAARGSGLPRTDTTYNPHHEPADRLLGRLAREVPDLTVVALGPLTNLADLAGERPESYRRLAGVHLMGGAVETPAVDGVAEWNAAADPAALITVLAGRVPVTVVPDDAVPLGTPEALDAPVVGAVAATMDYDKWWDLAAVAALVVGDAAETEAGAWSVDPAGRLRRTGPGEVRIVRSLDGAALDAAYSDAFAAGG